MNKIKFHHPIVFGLLSLVVLVALSGCTLRGKSNEEAETIIDELGITTKVGVDNSPVFGFSSVVSSTASEIYLSGRIVDAVKGMELKVVWIHVTNNTTIATEVLSGERSRRNQYDFITGSNPKTSYFVSRIVLNDIGWSTGDYEVIVESDNQVIKIINFEIVSNQDFDKASKKNMLRSFYLGSQINVDNQITIPTKEFSQDQTDIYAVALLRNVPLGTTVKASWLYIDNNQKITDFARQFSGNGYLPFNISLDDFSRLWSDGIWPIGHYKVNIYVDNTLIVTENFVVK